MAIRMIGEMKKYTSDSDFSNTTGTCVKRLSLLKFHVFDLIVIYLCYSFTQFKVSLKSKDLTRYKLVLNDILYVYSN